MQNTLQGWKLNSVGGRCFYVFSLKNDGKPLRSEVGNVLHSPRILIFLGGTWITDFLASRGTCFRYFVLFVGPRVRLKTVMFSTRFPDEAV